MGLDTSHDCWHGAYSAFMRWRTELARAAGIPPIHLMEGFYKDGELRPFHEKVRYMVEQIELDLPIKWECLKIGDALKALLYHSDCEGEIEWEICGDMADQLEALIPKLPEGEGGGHIGDWREKTQKFVDGLRRAHAAKENVEFH